MSKFVTSDGASTSAGLIAWQLVQAFWVGGVWFVHFVVWPALLHRSGLARQLVEDAARGLSPLVIGLAAVCVLIQSVVLVSTQGLAALWRDLRGQLLSCVAVLAAMHLLLAYAGGEGGYWLMYSYLAVAFLGLVLVLQPAPRPR